MIQSIGNSKQYISITKCY